MRHRCEAYSSCITALRPHAVQVGLGARLKIILYYTADTTESLLITFEEDNRDVWDCIAQHLSLNVDDDVRVIPETKRE